MTIRNAVSMLLLTFALCTGAQADTVALTPDHPDRYVVVKGDTLWDISARFLRDPWKWPDVWKINPQIDNPHLIYPGDTVVLTFQEGQPVLQLERAAGSAAPAPAEVAGNVVKLSPHVRVSRLERPIPTVPMDAVDQFLADARIDAYGDPAALTLLRSTRETLAGDRLIAVPDDNERQYSFIPSAPEQAIDGKIVALFDAISRVGRYQVVVLIRGQQDGMRPGNVLAAYRAGEVVRDTLPRKAQEVTLPDIRSGLVMVYRVFVKVRFALVMEAQRVIHLYDAVRNP